MSTHPTDGPIHGWFSLSYSNYLVLHRTFLQSMPIEWQERMVACLEELREAYRHIEQPEGFKVEAATALQVSDLDDAQLKQLGIAEDWYRGETPPDGLDAEALREWEAEHENPEGPTYSRNGEEIDGDDHVLLPAIDPVPHYNRGRTYIEPRICTRCRNSGIDPEHTVAEDYGDIVRELATPCAACQIEPATP